MEKSQPKYVTLNLDPLLMLPHAVAPCLLHPQPIDGLEDPRTTHQLLVDSQLVSFPLCFLALLIKRRSSGSFVQYLRI